MAEKVAGYHRKISRSRNGERSCLNILTSLILAESVKLLLQRENVKRPKGCAAKDKLFMSRVRDFM